MYDGLVFLFSYLYKAIINAKLKHIHYEGMNIYVAPHCIKAVSLSLSKRGYRVIKFF